MPDGLKTKKTTQDVAGFLDKIADETQRKDCFALLKLMKTITKKDPQMWGGTIVGFGSYHYKNMPPAGR